MTVCNTVIHLYAEHPSCFSGLVFLIYLVVGLVLSVVF